MSYYSMSDKGLALELGQRFKALRLRQNLTQEGLAERSAVSLNTIKNLEKGRAKLTTIIAVLRVLQALDELDHLLRAPELSPMELLGNKNRPRQRARRTAEPEKSDEDASW